MRRASQRPASNVRTSRAGPKSHTEPGGFHLQKGGATGSLGVTAHRPPVVIRSEVDGQAVRARDHAAEHEQPACIAVYEVSANE